MLAEHRIHKPEAVGSIPTTDTVVSSGPNGPKVEFPACTWETQVQLLLGAPICDSKPLATLLAARGMSKTGGSNCNTTAKLWGLQQKAKSKLIRETYESSPKLCKQCETPLPYEKRHFHVFCGLSCASTYNNEVRLAKHISSFKVCAGCQTKFHGKNKYCSVCITEGKHIHQRTTDVTTVTGAHAVRSFLLRTRPHMCQGCSRQEWEGHKIPLETEHVDGNSKNNTEENLKLLCPNCHALTPTYKSKNKGKGRHSRRQRYRDGLSY